MFYLWFIYPYFFLADHQVAGAKTLRQQKIPIGSVLRGGRVIVPKDELGTKFAL